MISADFSVVDTGNCYRIYPETKNANHWLRCETDFQMICMSAALSAGEACELMSRMIGAGFSVNATVRSAA